MNLLICSWEFGQAGVEGQKVGVEGICTERLVRALAQKCSNIKVLTSKMNSCPPLPQNVSVERIAFRPTSWRLASLLSQVFRTPIDPTWAWQRRVSKFNADHSVSAIYGRACPLASIAATYRLAVRSRLPYGIHFSDPLPDLWCPRRWECESITRTVRKITLGAAFVTFVTDQALALQERTLGIPLANKSFVLPHVALPPRWLGVKRDGGVRFLYTGSFYGRRKPDALLKGFAQFREHCKTAEFHFVGSALGELMAIAQRLGIQDAIRVFPYTADLTPHYENTDVLVATDATDTEPVFLTTKLVEYLTLNRRVLLVSPPLSSGAALVGQMTESARRADENAEAICSAMMAMTAAVPSVADYEHRFRVMLPYSPEAVSELFVAKVLEHLKRDQQTFRAGTPI